MGTRVRRRRYDGRPRLYGTQEAAKYLGISRRNLTYMLANRKIVEPVARLAATPVWSESQLDEQLFAWKDNPPKIIDDELRRQLILQRRLTILEDRWQELLATALDADTSRARIRAVWEGSRAVKRHKQGRSALATVHESRKALAEAKLLRLVADLRDEDQVFAGIAAELDEAADLRKELKAIKKARRERAVVSETVNAHEGRR